MTGTFSAKKPQSLRQKRFQAPRKHQKSALLLGLSTAMMATSPLSYAASEQVESEEIQLDALKIEDRTSDTNPYAEDGAPYKARISGDERRVKPLAETPQTIKVLTQTQIKDSGKSDLKEILSAQPGITLGTGENGNAFGDRYIIRGHEARSDVFVDGLRDPGMTTRESFAVEQVEITKGPSATFAGRGSTGGAVNSITKQASRDYDFSSIEAGVGTDDYRRVTVDSNKTLTDNTAVRFNLLHAYEEVPDRAPADRERNGFAASLSHHFSEKFSVTGDVYHLNADDKPDLGTYTVSGGDPVEDLPTYLQDQDFLNTTATSYTLNLKYIFDESMRVENKLRYGTTENGYVTTGARGTTRDATDPDAPGAETVGLSTHQGWQDVEFFVNQTNFFKDIQLGGLEHQWLFSLELSQLNVINGQYGVTNNGTTNCVLPGRNNTVNDSYCIVDPSGNYITDNGNIMGRSIEKIGVDSDYNIKTASLAAMDTVDLNDQWTIHGGVRLDSFDYSNLVGISDPVDYAYSDTLWNGHLGAVYNIDQNANVYLTYSTATNINGGESDLGTSCGYGGICTSDPEDVGRPSPESTQNFELGTKWNLHDQKLLFTAALFRIVKDDVMESTADDYDVVGTINTGKNQVQGAEFGLVGNITDHLSAQIGFTKMSSEILESSTAENVGKPLANFADTSTFAQIRYAISDRTAIGFSGTYSSALYAGQPDSAAGENYKVPSYTVFDAFASHKFSPQLQARLNVGNLTDENYYLAAYRSGAFTYIGDARNAQLSLTYDF
ncbi:MAG: TonB-dependent siderophore receptor [Gammaproteobacteria bacterium]|nr:TonB-dependent siderophore receptor [Gammaproteobacteria bacterium]HBF07554.1 TonB-dependent siderophore receptor [Gammaproteobacteria bacterium]|tara:strand:- start:110348 stop:112687 length:2340 start_codon:yes stop_codon:yes gene_type:complete